MRRVAASALLTTVLGLVVGIVLVIVWEAYNERRPGGRLRVPPGLVSEPAKEAPLTETNSLTTCPPMAPADCPGCAALREENRLLCEARVIEDEPLRARARLLRESIRRSDPRFAVEWHANELLAMMAARGMA